MWYAYLIGYVFSVLAQAIFAKSIVESLWDSISPGDSPFRKLGPRSWQGDVLARVEGVLYVSCLLLNVTYFIGLWLALKVVGHWKRWTDEGDAASGRPDGGTMFNIFMIGNSLSILYAFVGFKLIQWTLAGDVVTVIWVSLAAMALTVALWALIPNRKGGESTRGEP